MKVEVLRIAYSSMHFVQCRFYKTEFTSVACSCADVYVACVEISRIFRYIARFCAVNTMILCWEYPIIFKFEYLKLLYDSRSRYSEVVNFLGSRESEYSEETFNSVELIRLP